MKKIILLLLTLWSLVCSAQYNPYCLYDFAGWYRLSTINPTTGMITQIAPIPAVQFYVLGNKRCISTHDSTYTFAGHDGTDVRLYTVTLDSAIVLSSPTFNDNVVGLQYNCNDSTIYGLEEVGGGYNLVSIDRITGTTSQIGFVSGVTAYVGDGFVLDVNKGVYHFFGLFGSIIKMYSIDINSGLVTSSPSFPDNVTGLAYSCQDSSVYGLWEDGFDYKLERINPTTGVHGTVGVLTNIDPGFVAESASINYFGEYVYRGFSNSNNVLISVNVQNASIIDTVAFSSNVSGIDYYVCCSDPIIPVAIEENFEENTLSIYPNPFNTFTKVEWDQAIYDGKAELYDIAGKLVYEEFGVSGASYKLNRSLLKTGVYFIKIEDKLGELKMSGKLVAN